ncbi:uncharacterized protein LOC121859671, partial [Homarus americanus]|uniref:uncharacterized protein LOC121859671 n=1 Tax=Homarus americanus TaxID=6706 RepID=UPI001C477958
MVNEVTLSQEIYETREPDPSIRNNPGPSVRNDPGPSVRNDPGPSVRNDPGPSVRNDSGPSVRNDPGPSVRNDPGPSVRNDPGPSVRNDPGSSVRNDPGPSVRNDTGPSVRNDPGPSVRNDPGPSSRNNSSTRKKKKVAYYSHKERTAILDYISKTKRFKDIKGRLLWQDMAEAQICPGRTWQSLKEHFLKRIIPNLRHTEPSDKVTKHIYFPYTDCSTRENADIIHGSEVERQNHAVEENSILPKTNTGVSHMEEEERQEPHVEISPGRQNCLDCSEPFSVNLPIFIQGTGRCEDAMSEGFQPLDVDNEEDVSTDMFIETDSEREETEQFDLELESADSSVDVCEETQASELQDHTQRAPKNDEVQTFIPETEDLDNVENLEDVSTSRNNELEMEENCKSISSQETNCDIIDGMQNTLSEDKLFNTGSLVEGVIPDANFNQNFLTDSESSCESGSSSCFSGSFSFVIKDEQNLKNHMRSNEKDASPLKDDNTVAPIQKDSSDVDTSPEERQISYMAAGQPKTKHRSIRYTKRALREQYSTSPEEINRMHRKRFQPLKNKKGSRFACDMSSPQSEIVIQRPTPTKPDRNHVLQGALSVKPTRTTKRAASPEKRKKLTKLYDTYDSDNIESEDDHSFLSEDDFNTSEDEEIPQKGDQNASLPDKALYRDSFTGRFDRLYNPTTGCILGDKRRSVNTIRKIRRYEPYSVKEDLVIIKYIEKHKLQAAAGGIEMWQNMERAGILQ